MTRRQLRRPQFRSIAGSAPGKRRRRRSRERATRPARRASPAMSKSASSAGGVEVREVPHHAHRAPSAAGTSPSWRSTGCAGTAAATPPAGRSAYFSARRIIESCTMSSAASSIADGVQRALEGALLDTLEEVGQFFVGGQGQAHWSGRPARAAALSHRPSRPAGWPA